MLTYEALKCKVGLNFKLKLQHCYPYADHRGEPLFVSLPLNVIICDCLCEKLTIMEHLVFREIPF